MFTGLIRTIGVVADVGTSTLSVTVVSAHEDTRALSALSVLPPIALGDSIAVNGCCLTVTKVVVSGGALTLSFDLMPHTFEHTSLGDLLAGSRVNIEPALRAGDPLGGHMVQGHVDCVGAVVSVTPRDNALIIEIAASPDLIRYCIPRGSITVGGTSLTVVDLTDSTFTVSLIPETQQRTVLGELVVGDRVNLEADVIARYVERLVSPAGSV